MANKLELTWYGKDEPIKVEPRSLIFQMVVNTESHSVCIEEKQFW